MKKNPQITRRDYYHVRILPEVREKIPGLAAQRGISHGELVEAAINQIDEPNFGIRAEVIKAARGCIAEADEKLQMLERGHV